MDDLIARFCAGDEDAIRDLYRRHGGAVQTVARSIVGDAELVAEVVQQTFLNAWRGSTTFDPSRDIKPWLYSIARRTAIDVLRRERRPTVADHEPESDAAVTDVSFERTWEIYEVRQALDELPPDERKVVQLSHLFGLTHPEIAERLDVPLGTVKSRSGRAHRRLAAALRHLAEPADGADPPDSRASANQTPTRTVEGGEE